ncbi:MAG: protoheme IX farnesyltransferase [Candidatus Omnitrophica bacterium]|nr:protoheme IX farnesyltransferase [Candidatus Omnitrophota bacterium]
MNKQKFFGYIELTKPSIMRLVLVATALGFYFGDGGVHHPWILFYTLLGAGLTCAGAAALNHYIERDVDALMNRTKNRPLPSGLIAPDQALIFGVSLILSGVIVLCIWVNLLTSFLSLLTAFLYVLVYTPMKKMSWLNTTIGAIPGAIPPLGGWAAARGELGVEAWVLFLILFTWQHPHFYSIAWIFREDYKKAGFKMLPVVYPDSWFTFAQIITFTFALIGFSIVPSMIGMSGQIYFWVIVLVYIPLIPPVYQMGLLFFGTLLGQFNFVWGQAKKRGRFLMRPFRKSTIL